MKRAAVIESNQHPVEQLPLIEYRCPKCSRSLTWAIHGITTNCKHCKIWVNEETMAKAGFAIVEIVPLIDDGEQLKLFPSCSM